LGRLFDAASALLGLVQETTYEGEGPIKLEGRALTALAEPGLSDGEISRLIPLAAGPSKVDGRKFLLDPVPLVRRIAETRHAADGASLALLFHRAIADAALRGALAMRDYTGLNRIALSGGVFQNMLLRRLLVPKLAASGFEVYLNRAVPPGDGGLSLGQVYYRAPV
jgi:hydrogenase maturation protein HypF